MNAFHARISLFSFFLIPLFLVILLTCTSSATQCLSTMYASPLRTEERVSFTAEENIYCYIYCDQLETKKFTLIIDWVDPTGTVRGQTVEGFIINNNLDIYQKMFAIQLPRKGHVSRMFTGKSYSEYLFGEWTYRVHLNGIQLHENHFSIQ